MSPEQSNNVVVRLEVIVPQGTHGVRVQTPAARFGAEHERTAPLINEPPANQTRKARPVDAKYFICAHGTGAKSGDDVADQVFAKCYLAAQTLDPTPPNGTNWVQPDGNGNWEFGRNGNPEIEIPNVGVDLTLKVWAHYGDQNYASNTVDFRAQESTTTECPAGGPYYFVGAVTRTRARPAVMAHRWKFTLSGVRDRTCTNCGVLNTVWIVELDDRQPHIRRWLAPAPQSFARPDQHAWWRLQLCPVSGNWYLDCVQHPDQKLGTWISYRCHESRWHANAANTMTLNTDTGYCEMPRELTIEPA
ncbi:MAG: hypothetical protein L0Y71_24545 [Gemmataceae bacterium]|nr:hypothetical protein [Gemmataceae bacterium]